MEAWDTAPGFAMAAPAPDRQSAGDCNGSDVLNAIQVCGSVLSFVTTRNASTSAQRKQLRNCASWEAFPQPMQNRRALMVERFNVNCPARELLDRLGDKWTMV